MGGGEYIPLQNSLPPPGALFPPPWVMKLLRQDGLVGRDRWQKHGMQGRTVPAAGTVHLSLQPPPPLLGLSWAPGSHRGDLSGPPIRELGTEHTLRVRGQGRGLHPQRSWD